MGNLHHDSHQPGLGHHIEEETYKIVKILFWSISKSTDVLIASAQVSLHLNTMHAHYFLQALHHGIMQYSNFKTMV